LKGERFQYSFEKGEVHEIKGCTKKERANNNKKIAIKISDFRMIFEFAIK